jgi:hypothetical protein
VKSMAEGIPITGGGKVRHQIRDTPGAEVAASAAAAMDEARKRTEAAAYRASSKCSHPRTAFAFQNKLINPKTNCTVGWRNSQGLRAGQNLEDVVVLERFFGRGSPLHSGKDEWMRGGTFLEIGGWMVLPSAILC